MSLTPRAKLYTYEVMICLALLVALYLAQPLTQMTMAATGSWLPAWVINLGVLLVLLAVERLIRGIIHRRSRSNSKSAV